MAGPTVNFPHSCSRVSSSSRICGRAPSVVWAAAKLLHTENSVPFPESHSTGCTTGRSLMMKPRSAWPERNAISTPYGIFWRYLLREGARGSRAREERERGQPTPATPLCIDHVSVFLHRFLAREGEARTQRVEGIAATRCVTFITSLRYGCYTGGVTSRVRRSS